jgi:hypothetical protein
VGFPERISGFAREASSIDLRGMRRAQTSKVVKKFLLKVDLSRIPGAGQGLFTQTPVEKGDVILEYRGERLTYAQIRERYPDFSRMGYVFYAGPNHWVDAARRRRCLGRYANDARGRTRVKGLRNNAEFQVIGGVPYVVATRRIEAGAEILVSYGDDYWENHHEPAEDEPAKPERRAKKRVGRAASQNGKRSAVRKKKG